MTSFRELVSLPKLHAPFPDDFTSFDQATIRRTIALSQSESMWILTHSSMSPLSSLPSLSMMDSPVISPRAERAESMTMSLLTHRENEKLEKRMAGGDLGAQANRLLTDYDRISLSPTDRDFKRVLDRLDKVTSSLGGAVGRINIKERRPFECSLDEGDAQIFRVTTSNMPCPLRISLKRTGKTVMFVSRNEMEPSEISYDLTTKAEKLSVSDPGLRFKNDFLFIAVGALEDLRFTIVVTFGKETKEGVKHTVRRQAMRKDETLKALDELKRDESKLNEFYDRVERIERQRKEAALLRMSSKNFITLNKVVSPLRIDFLSEKMQALAERTTHAKTIRSKRIEAKKERALAMIFRREQLQEIARQQREVEDAKRKHENMQRSLITGIYLGMSIEGLYTLFLTGKAKAQEVKKKLIAVLKIQRCLRRQFRRLDHRGLALMTFRSCAYFLSGHYGPLCATTLSRQVKDCIEESRKNHVPPISAKAFYRKSKSQAVMLLKAVWRYYIQKVHTQWANIHARWNESLEKLLQDIVRRKSAIKKSRKPKRDEGLGYYGITKNAKETVLAKHMAECKLRYREKVREYLKGTKLILQLGAKAFMMRYSSLEPDEIRLVTAAPDFEYLVTHEEMVKLIDEALSLSASKPTSYA